MKSNLKFHALAITLVCLVIIIMYGLMRPAPVASGGTAVVPSQVIALYSATWGEGCNAAIAQALANPAPVAASPKDKPQAAPQPVPATPNNVLSAVSALCEGKTACSFKADVDTLGVDPLVGCYKRLVVSYRCFAYDKLSTLDVGQGERVAIACTSPKPEGTSHAPSEQ